MTPLEEWMDIKLLHKEGHSIKQIARHSGHSRNTVRRIPRQKEPRAFQAPSRASCLDHTVDRSTGLMSARVCHLF